MSDPLKEAVRTLENLGHECIDFNSEAAKAVIVCEALGLLAKQAEDAGCDAKKKSYYSLRTKCVIQASRLKGVTATVGVDDDNNPIVFLKAAGVGSASFHDPHNLLRQEITTPHDGGWNGIKRQQYALNSLVSAELRELLDTELLVDNDGQVNKTEQLKLLTKIDALVKILNQERANRGSLQTW